MKKKKVLFTSIFIIILLILNYSFIIKNTYALSFSEIENSDIYSDEGLERSSFLIFMERFFDFFKEYGLIITIVFIVLAIIRFLKKDPEKLIKNRVIGIMYLLAAFGSLGLNIVFSIVKSFKPVIYLYPEDEKEVTVKLGKKENLTCTYPKYKDGWKVLAKPSGDLIELETGKELYSLYWEGKNNVKHDLTEGFIVEGENAASFLEDKLEILGLNSREKQEFIIYWLPELEANKLNYIRFETKEQIDEDMPLEITPVPDTIIRIMMVVKKINKPLDVKEQVLTSVERKGFTVVEWGGTRI